MKERMLLNLPMPISPRFTYYPTSVKDYYTLGDGYYEAACRMCEEIMHKEDLLQASVEYDSLHQGGGILGALFLRFIAMKLNIDKVEVGGDFNFLKVGDDIITVAVLKTVVEYAVMEYNIAKGEEEVQGTINFDPNNPMARKLWEQAQALRKKVKQAKEKRQEQTDEAPVTNQDVLVALATRSGITPKDVLEWSYCFYISYIRAGVKSIMVDAAIGGANMKKITLKDLI